MKRKLFSFALCLALILTLAPAALATDDPPAEEAATVLTRTQMLDLTAGEVSYQSTETETNSETHVTTNKIKPGATTANITDTAEGWAWYPNGTTVDSTVDGSTGGTTYSGAVLVLSGLNLEVTITPDKPVDYALVFPSGTTVVTAKGSTNTVKLIGGGTAAVCVTGDKQIAFTGAGTLSAIGGQYGLKCDLVDVNSCSGTLNASGTGENSSGILCCQFNQNGGTVTATGTGTNSNGILGDVNIIGGGTLTAQGGYAAIQGCFAFMGASTAYVHCIGGTYGVLGGTLNFESGMGANSCFEAEAGYSVLYGAAGSTFNEILMIPRRNGVFSNGHYGGGVPCQMPRKMIVFGGPYRPDPDDPLPSESPVPVTASADVDQGQNSVEVSTRISDSTALVELSTGAQVKASSEALSVDASSLGSGVTAVEVGQMLVNCAAESGGLAVTLPNGNKVEFAKEAVQGAAQAASGEPLKLSLTTGNVADSSVRTALKGETPTAVFDLNISKGGEELHKFGGTVTATASYSLPAGGQDAYDMLHLTGGLPMQVTAWSATTASVTWPTTSASPFVLVKKGSVQTEAPFTDVASNSWAYTGVKYCWYYGMVHGTSADAFSPVAALTRAQLWTILARLDGQTLSGDMTAARTWAVSIGITDGTAPETGVTRQQLAATLWRYAKYKNYDVSVGEDTNILSYDDAFGVSEYAIPAIQWACGAGVMNGSGNKLLSGDTATRAQAAAMLMRFCQNTIK